MALARIQTAIVNQLRDSKHLEEEVASRIINSPEELSGNAVEKLLMEEHQVTEFQLLVAKSRALDLSPYNAPRYVCNEHTFEKFDLDFCVKNCVLPIGYCGDYYVIAVSNPFDHSITDRVTDVTKSKVRVLLSMERNILAALKNDSTQDLHKAEGFGDVVDALDIEFSIDESELGDAADAEESAPIIQLSSRIIEDAFYSGGSDIHIEPSENDCRVRVRVDGVLQERLVLPTKVGGALLARIKVMSNLDIAEKRLPQDGRIVFSNFTKKPINIDLRVSTAPLNHGEGAVLRILDKSKSTLPLEALGFEKDNLQTYKELIKRPYGMILHCGPTGSGKSMTLYSALNEINTPAICIRTAEDPIEYTLKGLCQMQMQRKIGLTFANALRAFLRQDPDVILVGEIRDKETADIAVESALTGHMLFSTLHTNDAPGTISRLTDMGIEPFMISASLVCVCAQRLMRRVCKTCRQQYEPVGREAEIISRAIMWQGPIFRNNRIGCPSCNGKGYKGRIGIHEMMVTSTQLVEGINKGLETAEIKKIAMFNGMKTLHQDSIRKVKAGITSIEEAVGTVPPDAEDIEAIMEEFEMQEKLKQEKDNLRRQKLEAMRTAERPEQPGEPSPSAPSGT